MFDAKRILDQLVSSGAAGGLAGGLAGGALANVMSGKKAKKVAGSALKLGGVALIGGLAYKAWQSHRSATAQQSGSDLPQPGSDFIPAPDDVDSNQALSLMLVRAMIAAAHADGAMDPEEHRRILGQLSQMEFSAEDKASVLDEFIQPLDANALARLVDSPQHAAEVYAASLLVVSPPSLPERAYLKGLSSALRLDPALIIELEHTISQGQIAA